MANVFLVELIESLSLRTGDGVPPKPPNRLMTPTILFKIAYKCLLTLRLDFFHLPKTTLQKILIFFFHKA